MHFNDINNSFMNNSFQLGLFTVFITVLVVVFVISPLSQILYLALFVKLFILFFIIYTIYLSSIQISYINNLFSNNQEVVGDVLINSFGLYIFIFLLGLCFIYILKTII